MNGSPKAAFGRGKSGSTGPYPNGESSEDPDWKGRPSRNHAGGFRARPNIVEFSFDANNKTLQGRDFQFGSGYLIPQEVVDPAQTFDQPVEIAPTTGRAPGMQSRVRDLQLVG
jgi:hypothetical protein